jgi:hypothetical protein
MKSQVRIIAFALLLFSSACSQSPTSPSQVSPTSVTAEPSAATFGVLAPQAANLTLDWATLTQNPGAALPLTIGKDPPGAPLNLAFGVSGTTVTLTWGPPGSGPTTASYVLQAGTGPGLSNVVNFNTGSTAGTFTATSVPSGTYYVRVRAANVDGLGDASNEVTIVVGSGPCLPPVAPTDLTGSASGNEVTLRWNDVAGAIAFIIEAGTSPGATNAAVVDTGSTATSFAAAAPAGTYYIRVRVRTACGTSAVSNEVSVTVGGVPVPTTVTGNWTGVSPDGLVLPPDTSSPCSLAWDLFLAITQDGTAASGTMTFRLRETRCGNETETATIPLVNGVVQNGIISFVTSDAEGSISFSGTVTASRMSGTVTFRDEQGRFQGTGQWAVNR